MVSSMNIGGVEKSLLSLLSVMPRDQYDVTLLLLEKKGGFLDLIPDWVKIEEAEWFKDINPVIMQPPQKTISDSYKRKQFKYILSFVISYLLSKYFNNRHLFYKFILKKVPSNIKLYDVAISYQGPTDIIDFYIANKVTAKKKISWIHFDLSKHLINDKLYKRLYSKFDKLYIVSKEAKNVLVQMFPQVMNKSDIFLNIVPYNLIRKLSKESKEQMDRDYKGYKLVTVGRLSLEKGQDIAVKALSMLRNDGYDVRWYCIGEGKYRQELERLIDKHNLRDHFCLLGASTNPYPFIAESDLYIQTSRHEGYCISLAEAKCLQKPIVTTNFIGALEQIVNGHTGYIVECNERDVYLKIKHLLDNESDRVRLTENLKQINKELNEDKQIAVENMI